MESFPALSRSLKNRNTKELHRDFRRSVDAGDQSTAVSQYMEQSVYGFEKRFVIEPWPDQVIRFEPAQRSALSKAHASIAEYFQKALSYHNEVLVGQKATDVDFDCVLDERYNQLIEEGREVFGKAASFLARRHRSGDRIKAFMKFKSQIMIPLENYIFERTKTSYLQIVMEPVMDHFGRYYFKALLGSDIVHTDNPDHPFQFKLPCSVTDNLSIQHWCSLYNCGQFIRGIQDILDYLQLHAKLENPVEDAVVQQRVGDLYELLPLFIKGWDCSAHEIPLCEGISAYIDLAMGNVCAYLAPSGNRVNHSVRHQSTQFIWDPFSGRLYWAIDPTFRSAELDILNANILGASHSHMLELYARGKFKVTTTQPKNEDEGQAETGSVSEAFVRAAHTSFARAEPVDLGKEGSDGDNEHGRAVIPSIRIQRFLEFMQREHHCSIESGKGSEIKIWRPRTRIYTLGRHKRNPTVPAWLIRQILKRLEIPEQEWIESLTTLR